MAYLRKTTEAFMLFGAKEETQGFAKVLRMKMTPSEKILWQRLKNRNIFGMKFRRQHPLTFYIADFYCHELQLVIEVDGPIHLQKERQQWDQNRKAELERMGIKVLRYTNEEITTNLHKVITRIKNEINKRKISKENP